MYSECKIFILCKFLFLSCFFTIELLFFYYKWIGHPILTTPFTDCFTLLNTAFDWRFSVDSLPEAKLKIFKNNKELLFNRDSNVKIVKEKQTNSLDTSYCLRFNKVMIDDAGLYKIELSNKAGSIESLGKLTVRGL